MLLFNFSPYFDLIPGTAVCCDCHKVFSRLVLSCLVEIVTVFPSYSYDPGCDEEYYTIGLGDL